MALGCKIVDFVRLNLLDDGYDAHCIAHVSVMQIEVFTSFIIIGMEVLDPLPVETA